MKNQTRKHKECVQNAINKTKKTHSCFKEHPINRDGDWHFLDVVGEPLQRQEFKPFAVECENESSKLQRESNRKDLIEWKRKNPDGEIFQVENSDNIDFNKLKRKPTFQRRGFVR